MKPNLVNASLPPGEKEMTLRELILNLRGWVIYLIRKWMIILPIIIAGAIAGALYNKMTPPKYEANCTFVLDFGGGNNMPAAAGGLASLVGIGDKNAGLFNDVDNIIWLYTTRLMIQNTLFTAVKDKGRDRLLIDWFLEESKLQQTVFKKYPEFLKVRFIAGNNYDSLDMTQSTIVDACINTINAKYLKVFETKKTENIINVNFISKDEMFSKLFTENLVATVNDYYIKTKTKKAREELTVLQKKADSFRNEMNTSLYQAASAVDNAPYANPAHTVLRTEPQKKQIDVQVSSTIYTQLMQNLELGKVSLAKATPLIQVVDRPLLPLSTRKQGLVKGIIIGMLLSGIIIIGILMAIRYYKIIMNPEPASSPDPRQVV